MGSRPAARRRGVGVVVELWQGFAKQPRRRRWRERERAAARVFSCCAQLLPSLYIEEETWRRRNIT
jgi:hypothetical protein